MFEAFRAGPQVLVGSSMGGWIALLLARALRRAASAAGSLAGLVLIAPAVDFTEGADVEAVSRRSRRQIETKGVWLRPSQYGEPYPITRGLIEEGRKHLLLGAADRDRLPGAHPAGRAGPGRAVAARGRTDVAARPTTSC